MRDSRAFSSLFVTQGCSSTPARGSQTPRFEPRPGCCAPDLPGGANTRSPSANLARGFPISWAESLGSHSMRALRRDLAESFARDWMNGLEAGRSAVILRRTGTPCLQYKGFRNHVLAAAQLPPSNERERGSYRAAVVSGRRLARFDSAASRAAKRKSRRVGCPHNGRQLK